MFGFGEMTKRDGNSGCRTSSKGKAILILAAALLLGFSASAWAVCPNTCVPGVDSVAVFGFRTMNASTDVGGTPANGLTMTVTDTGMTTGSGNVIVDFTFRALVGTDLQGMSAVWLDDRCSPTAPLMTLEDIIGDNAGGHVVLFSQGATPGNPPNSGSVCPDFATTGAGALAFSADADSGSGSKRVDPGEFLTLRFSLQTGKTFCNVIDCLQQANEAPAPRPGCVDASSTAGLRVAVNLDFPGQGSSAMNAPCAFIGGDCDTDGTPDECEISCSGGSGFCSIFPDCGSATDVNTNEIPDVCEDCPGGCDDDDACTVDTCDDSECQHTPINCDDGDPCTDDSCDPITGCVNTPKVCDDGNACTTDTCDPQTGACVFTPNTPAGQCCDPATGTLTTIDDGNACTTDSCNTASGAVSHVSNAAAGQCCDPATGTLTTIDDGNACTDDACNTATGVVSHVSNVPAGQCCDPATGTLTTIDDGNACTDDACNTATGVVSHVSNVPAGQCCNPATGALTPIDDGDACTIDTCNPNGSVTHTPIVCDDGLFCNGVETCVDGECVPGTPPCEPGQFCDENTDSCNECQDDEDCDDGLFCNGVETCVDGVCQPGTPPCAPGQTCNEETDACDEPPPVQVLPGACCFPDSSCASAADAAACSAAGGVFAGAGTDCSTTSCECGQPGGVSLLFSQLSFAPVCGGGCLMMIPVTILGFLTMRGTRRRRHKSRPRSR